MANIRGASPALGLTGREALLLSEPESDLPCSENDESKVSDKANDKKGSPLRKLNINQDQLEQSPLRDFEDKLSPLR